MYENNSPSQAYFVLRERNVFLTSLESFFFSFAFGSRRPATLTPAKENGRRRAEYNHHACEGTISRRERAVGDETIQNTSTTQLS